MGTIQVVETGKEVVKETWMQCGNNCTPEDYSNAFKEAGIANRFEELTEDQRKAVYSIPLAGLVYGTADAIKQQDITLLLEAGFSQTEIGGIILYLSRNQPKPPSESQVMQKVEEAVQGKSKNEVSALTPTGSKGNVLNVPDGTNKPTLIDNRQFSGHALDRMQRQGITPTAVEGAIKPQNAVIGKRPGTTAYHDKTNNMTVITDTKTGSVITVDFGIIRQ